MAGPERYSGNNSAFEAGGIKPSEPKTMAEVISFCKGALVSAKSMQKTRRDINDSRGCYVEEGKIRAYELLIKYLEEK